MIWSVPGKLLFYKLLRDSHCGHPSGVLLNATVGSTDGLMEFTHSPQYGYFAGALGALDKRQQREPEARR